MSERFPGSPPLRYLGDVTQSDGGTEQLDANTEFKKLSRMGTFLGFLFTVLEQRGWLESAHSGIPARSGKPYPLLTWPFVDYLESLDLSGFSLLEFGSGQSTLFFQERFRRVLSLETNPQWHASLAPRIDHGRTQYLLADEASLASGAWRAAAEPSFRADFALVDCACNRKAVARELLAAGAPPFVILDNADWHPNTAQLFAGAGYLEVPFWGLKNGEDWESCTSLFVLPAEASRLRPRRDVRPAMARAMTGNVWDQDLPG